MAPVHFSLLTSFLPVITSVQLNLHQGDTANFLFSTVKQKILLLKTENEKANDDGHFGVN